MDKNMAIIRKPSDIFKNNSRQSPKSIISLYNYPIYYKLIIYV